MTNIDPLWHLSRGPIIDGPGFYALSGPSPYTVEFLRPNREFLAEKLPNESLRSYMKRKMAMPDWSKWEEEFAHHGLDINHICSLYPPLVTPPFQAKRSRTGWVRRIMNFFRETEETCP